MKRYELLPGSRRGVLLRALTVTGIVVAADWTWWAYGHVVRLRTGPVRGHYEIGESAAGHLWFEVRWRLPITLVSAGLGFIAAYLLLRSEGAIEAPRGGFEHLRLYGAALILLMLVHVLVGMMHG